MLAKIVFSHAEAEADIVALSDMMDGWVRYICECFEENNFHETAIMAYSAKYASAFYGPFREAAGSVPILLSHILPKRWQSYCTGCQTQNNTFDVPR